MGNDKDGALGDQIVEGLLDLALSDGIDASRGFIENNKGWVFQEHPSDGESLFFSLAEADAFFADVRIELFGKRANEVPGAGQIECAYNFIVFGVRFGQQEIITGTR